jgi:hypothetical protein
LIPTLELGPYWEKLIDHYYDNVHWDEVNDQYKPYKNINEWLSDEYDARAVKQINKIIFNDERKMSWFLLRWS